MKRNKIITSETVFRGHPDKVADQISDHLLTELLKQDPNSRVAIETLATNKSIFLGGEVTTEGIIDYTKEVIKVIEDIGYSSKGIKVITDINQQSPDIAQGVNEDGAGDNGIMYGYAYKTYPHISQTQYIMQEFSKAYDNLRKEKPELYYPDGKVQITGVYDQYNNLIMVTEIIICYQNPEKYRDLTDLELTDIMVNIINKSNELYNTILNDNYWILINPTGRFEIGGIEGDAGVTGRKLLIDNYHASSKVGGGAYSGKDPSKVDRTGAYFARKIAIEKLKEHDLDECKTQISYGIGLIEPRSIMIVGYKDGKQINIEPEKELYKRGSPQNIIKELELLETNYYQTAQFGHYGNGFKWDEVEEEIKW